MSAWAGEWRVDAILPDGVQTYEGRILISRRGAAFALKWDISDGAYFGVGAAARGRLFVSCSPYDAGINLLLVNGANARHFVDGAAATPHSWAAPEEDGFSVGAARCGDHDAEAMCFGVGALRAAAWGRDLNRHVLLVYERVSDDELRAQWTLGRDAGVGREMLRRL